MSERNGLPISHEEVRAAADSVLSFPGADGIEVVFMASRIGLTRYAVSEIIQNTVRSEVRADVRAIVGDKTASAVTTQLDPEQMKATAARALEAAHASKPDPELPSLATPTEYGVSRSRGRWDEATATAPPARRAQAVADMLRTSGEASTAGIYETSAHSYAVVSSAGMDCFDAYTRCVATSLVDMGQATGWGEDSSHSADEVDAVAATKRAKAKAEAGHDATDIAPGTYEVVLEQPAVAVMLEYMAYAGFGAKQVIEGESFLADLAGHDVAAPAVTIADDVQHPRSVGIGFDFEGVPRQRVAVIDEGRATGPVTDVRTARKLGLSPTGHGSGSNEFGPYAANVVLEPGGASHESLIGGVKDGLLVTRFHYVNILDRPSTLLTGMTRDGTFRIRDGQIAEPVHNLRFTQSVLAALASVQDVGADLAGFAPEFGSFGSTAAPALRIGEFRFTSGTSH